MTVPPAGWYPDPEMANTMRYWDGSNWSEHVAPGFAQAQAESEAVQRKKNDDLPVWGGVLGLLFPIAGFVIGCILVARDDVRGGIIIVWSMLVAIGGWMLLVGSY